MSLFFLFEFGTYTSIKQTKNRLLKNNNLSIIVILLLRYIHKNLKHCLAYEMNSFHKIQYCIEYTMKTQDLISWSELGIYL